jgi:hypothetical protein
MKDIYLVSEMEYLENEFTKCQAFESYEAATNFFSSLILQFFFDAMHDTAATMQNEGALGRYLMESYDDDGGIRYWDGYGKSIDYIPDLEDFNEKHGCCLEFEIGKIATIKLQTIPYKEKEN